MAKNSRQGVGGRMIDKDGRVEVYDAWGSQVSDSGISCYMVEV